MNGIGQLLALNADGSGLKPITNLAAETPVFSSVEILPNMTRAVTLCGLGAAYAGSTVLPPPDRLVGHGGD